VPSAADREAIMKYFSSCEHRVHGTRGYIPCVTMQDNLFIGLASESANVYPACHAGLLHHGRAGRKHGHTPCSWWCQKEAAILGCLTGTYIKVTFLDFPHTERLS
jgi:hypothetical protein